jgi:hypothetical protein
MTKTLLATAVAVLALVAAGCGGSDESSSASPTDEWADGFCTAVTSWTDSIQSFSEQFTDLTDLSSFSNDGLESAANDIKSSTQTLVDDLKGLGAPETESGQAVKDSLDELSSTLESEVATIDDAVEGASSTGLPSAFGTFTTSLQAMGAAFSSTLDTLQSADAKGELQTALEDSPACADISG